MKAYLPIRTLDKFGSGEYGASRVGRKHKGEDRACVVGTSIYPYRPGIVTKIGYPYPDDLSYRYVQISDSYNYDWRYFYLDPKVKLHDLVDENTILGTIQDLDKRYEHITIHCHLEIKRSNDFIDPSTLI